MNRVFIIFYVLFIGYTSARSGLQSEDSAPPAKVQQCREGCLDKVRLQFCFFFVYLHMVRMPDNIWSIKIVKFQFLYSFSHLMINIEDIGKDMILRL